MPKRDEGHALTDEALADLEKRISRIYADARDDMQAKVDEYFSYYRKREEHQRELLKKGEITEEQFKQWRLNQMGRGQRFEAMRDKLADRMTRANEVAAGHINDATPGIYSLNRNYAAYTIEQVAGDVDFTLWDEQTVKRLIVEEPDLMPYYPPERAVERGIDLAWGKKQITAQVTSGILQGESIKHLADRLQNNIPDMNRVSAIRAARTAVTGAQNAGRVDSYLSAEKMGIDLKQEWVATLDGRTRHSHAVMDGEKVEPGKKFSNGCRYPGDPSGPPQEIYNCRCTLIASLPDVDTSDAKRWARDPETGEAKLIEDVTYSEWAGWKEKERNGVEKQAISEYNDTIQKHVSVDKAEVFEAAKRGERHGGIYNNAMKYRQKTLEKSISSHVAQVLEHSEKIKSPSKHDSGWPSKSQREKDGLLKKWNKDMRRNAEQAEIEIAVWNERFSK